MLLSSEIKKNENVKLKKENIALAESMKIRYEQIRHAKLSGLLNHKNHGFALIVTQGMHSWIKAWSKIENAPNYSKPLPPKKKPIANISEDLVNALANITLATIERRF